MHCKSKSFFKTLCISVAVSNRCVQVSQSPEEGISSPGAEVTGSCELLIVGAGNSPLEEKEVLSTAEPSF